MLALLCLSLLCLAPHILGQEPADEHYDPRPHGHTPVYSRARWPKTVKVPRDGVSECNEFPDKYGVSVEYLFAQSNYEVYCWYNMTLYKPEGELMLRTVDDCYVLENNVAGEDIDFQEELPWCGYVKPYKVAMSPLLWHQTWNDTAHYTYSCYREPNLNSVVVESAGDYPHLYCWVEGGVYNTSNRWYESARLEDYKKCYFPEEIFYFGQNNTVYEEITATMPGAGKRCP